MALAATAGPALAADDGGLEGEALELAPGVPRQVWAREDASGQKELVLARNGTATGRLTTPKSDTLWLQLRGQSYRGAPHVEVRVDGKAVGAYAVEASQWRTFVVKGDWAAGEHQVEITFVNDLYKRGKGDRNVFVDRVDFVTDPTSDPTPTLPPTPTPTATPSATPTATPSA